MSTPLATGNLTLTDIRTAIGEASTATGIVDLCMSDKVNRWSKHKPLKRDSSLNPVACESIDIATNWSRYKPDNVWKIGDFMEYQHETEPPMYTLGTDCTIYSDLYPTGSPQNLDFVFTMKRTAADSYSLSTGDICLNSWYIATKVTLPNGDLYVHTWAQVGDYDTYTATLSAGLNDPTVPNYTNLPYSTGSYTVTTGVFPRASTGWESVGALNDFVSLPTAAEFPDNFALDEESEWTFTVHDWINTQVSGCTFPGKDYTYSECTIYTSLANWKLISNPSWVDITVYSGGSQVTDPNLWEDGMSMHVVPNSDNTSGVDRTGSIELGDGTDVLWTVSATQTDCQDPTVTVTTVNFSATDKTGSVAYGSTNLTYSLKPTDVGLNVSCSVSLKLNTVEIDTDTIILKDGSTYNGSFTLADAADCGDDYIVQITK